MGLEIERRFLLKSQDWRVFVASEQHFRQCYLAYSEQGIVVRVRISDKNTAYLTIKAPAQGIARHEFEYRIPMKEAEELWLLSSHRIQKKRYFLTLQSGEWIVDCFEDNNHPLMIAEVEIASEDVILQLPDWCGIEITGMNDLSNAALARNPLSRWSCEQRSNFGLRL